MKRKNPARRLDNRLWFSLGLFAGLIVLHQFLVQPALIRLTSDAPAINIAGRQRMLSQKLTKSALALKAASDADSREQRHNELASTLQTWRESHDRLRAGEPATFLGRSANDAMRQGFLKIERPYQEMVTAAQTILTDPDGQSSQTALEAILRNESEFLTQMHSLVGLYEEEARQHVWQLQMLGLTLMVIILGGLLAIQLGIMRPELSIVGHEWDEIESHYQLLVESMTDGLVVFDRAGAVEFASPHFCEMIGRTAPQIQGRIAATFIAEEDVKTFEKLLQDDVQIAGPFDLKLRSDTGRIIETLVSPRRMTDVQGSSKGLLLVVTDVTTRKAIEQRSQELQSQLAHGDRLKSMGAMAAAIAHEINQPLGAISNYAEGCIARLTEPTPSPAEMISPLKAILRAAHRCGEIVRRTKAFSRRLPHQLSVESVNDLVLEVEELCRPEARRRSVTFESNLADGLPEILVDGIQIQQVLTNLIQNAFTALEAVGPTRRKVQLTTRLSADDELEFTITDTGPGLAVGEPQSLFEPFVTTKQHGTGLGLAIARGIVESHGGRIWAEANFPEGAVFRFTLPLAPPLVFDNEFVPTAETINVG